MESSGTNTAQSWHDVTADNAGTAGSIQDALAEKIERRLKQ